MLEFYFAVNQSEKGIIGASADIVAGMNFGSPLSDKDIAGKNRLTVGFLNTDALRFAITFRSLLDQRLYVQELQTELNMKQTPPQSQFSCRIKRHISLIDLEIVIIIFEHIIELIIIGGNQPGYRIAFFFIRFIFGKG